MNFSPDNRSTLTDLLAAMKGGLDPGTGYSIYQNTVAQQEQQAAERQAQMAQYAQQVVDYSQSGLPYGATRDIMDTLTPQQGVPNQVQGQLDTMYPGAAAQPQSPWAGMGGAMGDAAQGQPGMQSPAYQQPAPGPDQRAMMQQAQDMQLQESWTEMAKLVSAASTAGASPTDIRNAAAAQYPQLLAADPSQFAGLLSSATGVSTVQSPTSAFKLDTLQQ